MPLSKPVERSLSHTRIITCKGYERADGLWDIEAEMEDTKAFAFANQDRGGTIQADEALHNMKVRMTVDDMISIHAIEVVTDASPFNVCPSITETYQQLVGKTIGPGWNQYLKMNFAGVRGCTHITELFSPLATTAFQTVFGAALKRDMTQPGKKPPTPRYLNSCHALSASGSLVQERWPDDYVSPSDTESTQALS